MIRQENKPEDFCYPWDSEKPKYASYVVEAHYSFGKSVFADRLYGATLRYATYFCNPIILERAVKRYERYLESFDGEKPDELVVKMQVLRLDEKETEIEYNRYYGVDSIKQRLKEITYTI